MPRILEDFDVARRLERHAGWSARAHALQREFEFSTFVDAIDFVGRVAVEAEAMDHHPDIDVRYRRVILTLKTHSVGGITDLDFDLAARLDRIAG